MSGAGGPSALRGGAVAGVGLPRERRSGPSTTGQLGALAGKVAGTIAREFGLDPDARRRRPDEPVPHDPYEVEASAAALAEAVGASAAEAGAIARALHAFVAEVAAMFGALPDANALEAIRRVVHETPEASGGSEGAPSAAQLITAIEGATRRLQTA